MPGSGLDDHDDLVTGRKRLDIVIQSRGSDRVREWIVARRSQDAQIGQQGRGAGYDLGYLAWRHCRAIPTSFLNLFGGNRPGTEAR